MDERKVLLAGQEIEVGGEKLTIKPLSWADTLRAVTPLGKILKFIMDNGAALDAATGGLGQLAEESKEASEGTQTERSGLLGGTLAAIMSVEGIEEVVAALLEIGVLATKKEAAFLESLPLDDAITVGRVVFEVNRDFFIRTLAKVKTKKKAKDAK